MCCWLPAQLAVSFAVMIMAWHVMNWQQLLLQSRFTSPVLQVLLSAAALEPLEQVPAVTDLLSYILIRDAAQRPSAGDVHARYAVADILHC